MSIGMGEVILVLLIAIVVVGPRDLPKIARAMARTVKSVKSLYGDIRDEIGLDDELRSIKKDVDQVAAQADVTSEWRGMQQDLDDIRKEIGKVKNLKI